jgi:CxxC motif-containing protein
MQLVENLHRSDLLPMEEAEAYKRMNDELGYTYKEIALRVGKSEKHIGRYMKMISLPEEIAEKIDKGDISISKAQFLCSLPDAVITDILAYRTSWIEGNFYNADEMRRAVQSYYMKELSDQISFDLNKEYKDSNKTVWPACTSCPHKNQIEMFEEFVKEGKCPYAPCFEAKEEIAEKRKKKSKVEVDEDDDKDPWDETEKEKERRLQHELYKKIEEAVEMAKVKYYFKAKSEIGFNPLDMLKFRQSSCLNIYEDDPDEDDLANAVEPLFKELLEKGIKEIRESNDYELVLKALMLERFYERVSFNEDLLAQETGCEQCPDDILKAARDKAMGIDTQAKEANAKKKK